MRAGNLITLIVVTLIILSCSSCRKEPACTPTFVEIQESMKDYIFAPGSQWIYLHENTGVIDTVTLESLIDTVWQKFPPQKGQHAYHFCYNRYYSSYRDVNYKEIVYRSVIARVDTFQVGEGQGVFVYNSSPYAAYDSLFLYIELLPSYVINGNAYSNVRHFRTKGRSYQSAFKFDTDTYYAPEIGLIKWAEHDTINGDQTFSLLNRAVVKYSPKDICN